MVLAALSPLCLQARGIADIIECLSAASDYRAAVTYSVTLPSRDDDVIYSLSLSSVTAPSDTLSPCAYLIRWRLDTPSGPAEGWTSYFDGNLYRYRDHRLREYHTSWDPSPFMPASGSHPRPGVQEATQFVELFPAYIARDLRAMTADTLYSISGPKETVCDGRAAICVKAEMTVDGECVRQVAYWFDRESRMPLRIDIESNPASITEQTITVRYADAEGDAYVTPMSEEALMSMYPEHFEKYRESNFRIENLRGTPLPTFTLPTATGGRYAHQRGEGFRSPTVVALLDPDTSFSSDMVCDLRSAVDASSVPADIIWAVASTNPDRAEELVGRLRTSEHLLLNARSLARDCGAASLPVVILSGADGVVKDVLLGYNPDLSTVVVQSIALL